MLTKNFYILECLSGTSNLIASNQVLDIQDFLLHTLNNQIVYPKYTSTIGGSSGFEVAYKHLKGFSTPPVKLNDPKQATTTNYNGAIILGSSPTPSSPTINDYDITDNITSGLNPTSVTVQSQNFVNGKIKLDLKFGLTNTSGSDITVSQLYYVLNIPRDAFYIHNTTDTPSGTGVRFLIDHTVLDSPITIPAGESATINYYIYWPYVTEYLPS